ncbi:hypothetical protein Q4598_17850 [Phaeobacter inhibens]|uniref:hypothetical protein n=1 Tax=Phaeobacter inhibens TaxID=221822 RepID=UPI0026E1173A|nr:hypothetical protein [Phaeobacter inhibens]MDO6758107.1 hypothetical protein [Phaeobacter inhibens]
MTLKPPSRKDGDVGLSDFREAVKLAQKSLKNKFDREFHRKELSRWQKYYRTLSAKRPEGSDSAIHYAKLSKICGELLEEYGPEPPSKKRPSKIYAPAPLTYPAFPEGITHRLHFLEGPGIRRQRAIKMAEHAPFVSRQTSGMGRVLLSVGLPSDQVQLFERIVETIGDLMEGDLKKAGFDIGYEMRPAGVEPGASWHPNPLPPELPWARIVSDNGNARGYTWQARVMGDAYLGHNQEGAPKDIPDITDVTSWDPDGDWFNILQLTDDNRVEEALQLVEKVPGEKREILFDEVVYLRFLTSSVPRAADLIFLSRKHIRKSLISERLEEEFSVFQDYLDAELQADPPLLENISRLDPDFGRHMLPPWPPASDWPATKAMLSSFTTPGGPRGRIFSVNIDIGEGSLEQIFASYMLAAENAFRRDRSIPEIGRGWVSEVALLDLVRNYWPSAVHQWRAGFLGLQSVDIFVPEERLAIEYQGQQHYEAVDLFGGQEGLIATQARDERKRKLLRLHDVRLLEWPYDAPIQTEELRGRLSALGIQIPV